MGSQERPERCLAEGQGANVPTGGTILALETNVDTWRDTAMENPTQGWLWVTHKSKGGYTSLGCWPGSSAGKRHCLHPSVGGLAYSHLSLQAPCSGDGMVPCTKEHLETHTLCLMIW